MNLIKVPWAGFGNREKSLTPEKIVEQLKKVQLNENHLFLNYQIKEIGGEEEMVFDQSKKFFQTAEQNVFLGGSHAITLPLVKAFSQVYPNAGIIIFDAHPDCRNDLGGEDLVSGLVKQKIIKKENIFLVGLRSWTPEEYRFLKEKGIRYFSMQEIALEGAFEVSESFMPSAKDFGALYVSMDIDVLDPAFAPGTGSPEPGGLSTRELLFFIHRLKRLKNFKAADLAGIEDKDEKTILVGTKIIEELF